MGDFLLPPCPLLFPDASASRSALLVTVFYPFSPLSTLKPTVLFLAFQGLEKEEGEEDLKQQLAQALQEVTYVLLLS